MKHIKIVFSIIIFATAFLAFHLTALGQSMTATPVGVQEYNRFLVADLGLTGGGKANTIFTVQFDGASSTDYYYVSIIVVQDGSGERLLVGDTDAKVWNTSFQNEAFYNHNISDSSNLGGKFSINDEAGKLYDQILATGAAPEGDYLITLTLYDAGATPPSGAHPWLGSGATLVVTQQVRIRILPPYFQPTVPASGKLVWRDSLNFDWNARNLQDLELHIFERDPSGSVDEVTEGVLPLEGGLGNGLTPAELSSIKSILSDINFENQMLGLGGMISYQELLTGLQEGEITDNGTEFYWQIYASIITSHGNEPAKGPISKFRYYEYPTAQDPEEIFSYSEFIEMIEQINPGIAKRLSRLNITEVDGAVLDNNVTNWSTARDALQNIIDNDVELKSMFFQR